VKGLCSDHKTDRLALIHAHSFLATGSYGTKPTKCHSSVCTARPSAVSQKCIESCKPDTRSTLLSVVLLRLLRKHDVPIGFKHHHHHHHLFTFHQGGLPYDKASCASSSLFYTHTHTRTHTAVIFRLYLVLYLPSRLFLSHCLKPLEECYLPPCTVRVYTTSLPYCFYTRTELT
jgi:hypothetical protein